jgi:transposase
MQTSLNVGVDVAKDTVVVACATGTFPTHTLPNMHQALVGWLNTLPVGTRIGLEASGCYHQGLADLAHHQGFIVFVLNPADTRHYAKACGIRAKTDRVDATLIARLIAHEHQHLRPYVPPTREQRQIDQLLRRRATLTTIKVSLTLTLKDLPGFVRERNTLLTKLEAVIAKIDQTLDRLMAVSPARQQTFKRLQTIVGVGPLVGVSLANTLERIAFQNADAFIAFVGFDPRPKDSGQRNGRRRLSKRGPAELRRLLFNAAMSATRTPTFKPIYNAYRQRGLASTTALVIIARKIARTAWSVHHYHTVFDPKRLTTCLT